MHRGIRAWLGCLAPASLGINEEKAAGQEMSGSSLLWLSFCPWLCRAVSVWLHLGPGVALLSFCPPAENRAKDVCGK